MPRFVEDLSAIALEWMGPGEVISTVYRADKITRSAPACSAGAAVCGRLLGRSAGVNASATRHVHMGKGHASVCGTGVAIHAGPESCAESYLSVLTIVEVLVTSTIAVLGAR